MKNIARLVLFFSLTFIVALILGGVLRYMQLTLDAARTIPIGSPVELREFLSALQKIVPLILYISILISLSYTARQAIPMPAAIFCLFILAGGAALGVSLGLLHLKSDNTLQLPLFSSSRSGEKLKTLGAPGLILSQGDTVMVVLGDPGEAGSPRMVSIPGRPLIYQEVPSGPNNTIIALPPAPFRDEESYLMNGFLVDSALVANQFETRLGKGLIPFAIYGGALIFLLVSLRFVLDLSSWPLANLFSGALVFRGILAFQTFVDSRIVQDFILNFFDKRIDASIISPVIFIGLALLILLYTFLGSLVRGRIGRGHEPRRKKRREGRP
ncbi:hypothetical protein [Treponema primitia]|uniref:hypothetical protein n=1 Tax=Treponema primitia TaxID=88058 RepID=UPI0002554F3F|nr:hypothetical protein [Treponema primitia]